MATADLKTQIIPTIRNRGTDKMKYMVSMKTLILDSVSSLTDHKHTDYEAWWSWLKDYV